MTLTSDEARNLFHYDQDAGVLIRKVTTSAQARAGDAITRTDAYGYVRVKIRGKGYSVHRVCWLIAKGYWPSEIDHIDGCKTNNAITNLREASRSTNCQNIKKPLKTNSTGYLGVTFSRGSYKAQIKVGGKRKQMSGFKTPEEAHAAYLLAKRKLHSGFVP